MISGWCKPDIDVGMSGDIGATLGHLATVRSRQAMFCWTSAVQYCLGDPSSKLSRCLWSDPCLRYTKNTKEMFVSVCSNHSILSLYMEYNQVILNNYSSFHITDCYDELFDNNSYISVREINWRGHCSSSISKTFIFHRIYMTITKTHTWWKSCTTKQMWNMVSNSHSIDLEWNVFRLHHG